MSYHRRRGGVGEGKSRGGGGERHQILMPEWSEMKDVLTREAGMSYLRWETEGERGDGH